MCFFYSYIFEVTHLKFLFTKSHGMNSSADLYSKKRKGYRKKNDFVYFIILSREILVNGNYYLCAKYFFNYPRLIYCNIFLYAKKIFNL